MKTHVLQRARCVFWSVALCVGVSMSVVVDASAGENTVASRLSQFTPQGEALEVQQVRVQFAEAMRPLGDLAGAAPMSFACQGLGEVTAQARWMDERTWAVDFSELLPAGVHCEFKPVAGLLDVEGKTVAMASAYQFNTGGPRVLEATVLGDQTQSIDETALFIVQASGDLDRASVERKVVCVADGIVESIPVKLLSTAEQKKLAERVRRDDLRPQPRQVIFRCARRLPSGARVRLHWAEGIRGATGWVTTANSASWHEFKVRGEFSVTVNCQRENARANCHPLTPISLSFSAPVMRSDVEKIRLVGPKGREWKPKLVEAGEGGEGGEGGVGNDGGVEKAGSVESVGNVSDGVDAWDAFVDQVSFQGPFPPETEFHLKLPSRIRDDAGRPLAHRERLAALVLKTADYPPLLKFAADFGIVEYKAGGVLPVTLRNLDRLSAEAGAGLETLDGTPPGTAARVRVRRATRDEDVIELFRLAATYPETEQDIRSVSLLKGNAQAKTWLLPKPHGAKAMEVVGLPLGEPGYYLVEAESARLGSSLLKKGEPMFVHSAVLNTNLAVHFKQGAENQLVWVTTLDSGQPVADAKISIRDCRGTQLAFGKTGADGTMAVRRRLPEQPRHCSPGLWGYYVSARTPSAAGVAGVEDFSFVLSTWKEGIERWRFSLPSGEIELPEVLIHTVFDRPLFRTGETVHMKHVARRHTTAGYAWATRAQLPEKAVIQLENSDVRYELPLIWKAGSAESTWTIPSEAKLGKYGVSFLRAGQKAERVSEGSGDVGDVGDVGGGGGGGGDGDGGGDEVYGSSGHYWLGGSFRVGEFRLPILKGEVAPTQPTVVGSQAFADVRLNYLAGGAASGEKVRVRSELTPVYVDTTVVPEALSGYVFNTPSVSAQHMNSGEWRDAQPSPVVFDDQRDVVLDASGSRRVTVANIPGWNVPGLLRTEMEYTDPSGEIHVASSAVRWLPSRVQVGIALENNTAGKSGDQTGTATATATAASGKARIITVDSEWKPRANTAYRVMAWQYKTLVHRKRLIGGYYAYDSQYVLRPMGEVCKGYTDSQGQAECVFTGTVKEPGQVSAQMVLEVISQDDERRQAQAATSLWQSDGGDVAEWYDQGESDRIDIKSDKKRYEPGDTAHFTVQMPFRQATALVTVEREGVLDRWVMPLSGNQPGFDLPIKPHYGPNVFVSVLVVRGRVGDVQPTALVDLGKPAYKLGIVEIEVGRKGYELKVMVEPAQAAYRTREEARVNVRVTKPDGSPAKGGEFALAAVDEALLELAPNRSWDMLTRMLAKRGWSVETATAQSQVVGKRHFGLKAVPAGGGGGRQPTRELFDTLILWQSRVLLDDNGEATVKLPLNDSLTRIRVVAVAQQGVALFGTGMASFRTTKDVQLFSGLPPLVRDADRFRAAFTVRNLTTAAGEFWIDASVKARVDGQRIPLPVLARQKLSLAAGEGREVAWTLDVPENASRLDWRVEVRSEQSARSARRAQSTNGAADTKDAEEARDALQVSQKVIPGTPVRVQSASLVQVDGKLELPVLRPQAALPGRGGISVSLQPTLSVARTGVRDWMEAYPYQCLEQQLSRVLATGNRPGWEQVQNTMSAYLDNNGLAAFFRNPRPNGGSPVLTAFILNSTQLAGYPLQDELRARMLDGLKGFLSGRVAKDDRYWSSRDERLDLAMRKLKAIEALARYGQATPQMLASLSITPDVWPLAGVVSWLSIVQQMPGLPDRNRLLNEAETQLRARLLRSGTQTQFVREADDAWWWQLDTPDVIATRATIALMEQPAWRAEIPRLVRGVVARQRAARWDTTTANAWGVIMLDRFQRQFENLTVTGVTKVTLESEGTNLAKRLDSQSVDWTSLSLSPAAAEQNPSTAAPRDMSGVDGVGGVGEIRAPLRFDWPQTPAGAGKGLPAKLLIQHQGAGKPWANIQTRAAVPLAAARYAGFEVHKEIVAVERRKAGVWSKGDVIEVRLSISAPQAWTWVVLDDPIPAGATLLGSGLGRESQMTSARPEIAEGSKAREGGAWWAQPVHVERSFEAYRAYYEYFRGTSKQPAHIVYRMRLNNAGEFTLPPTHVEAMYAPENFGELPGAVWRVAE